MKSLYFNSLELMERNVNEIDNPMILLWYSLYLSYSYIINKFSNLNA